MILPEGLLASAGLSDQATIVGKGEIFEIWEPKAFAEHAKNARKIAHDKRYQLRGTPPGSKQ